MNSVVLYKDDFRNDGLGMSWEGLLESLGVETHTLVAGRLVDNEIDQITIYAAKVEAE